MAIGLLDFLGLVDGCGLHPGEEGGGEVLQVDMEVGHHAAARYHCGPGLLDKLVAAAPDPAYLLGLAQQAGIEALPVPVDGPLQVEQEDLEDGACGKVPKDVEGVDEAVGPADLLGAAICGLARAGHFRGWGHKRK